MLGMKRAYSYEIEYENGEIKRLIVMAESKEDALNAVSSYNNRNYEGINGRTSELISVQELVEDVDCAVFEMLNDI